MAVNRKRRRAHGRRPRKQCDHESLLRWLLKCSADQASGRAFIEVLMLKADARNTGGRNRTPLPATILISSPAWSRSAALSTATLSGSLLRFCR